MTTGITFRSREVFAWNSFFFSSGTLWIINVHRNPFLIRCSMNVTSTVACCLPPKSFTQVIIIWKGISKEHLAESFITYSFKWLSICQIYFAYKLLHIINFWLQFFMFPFIFQHKYLTVILHPPPALVITNDSLLGHLTFRSAECKVFSVREIMMTKL